MAYKQTKKSYNIKSVMHKMEIKFYADQIATFDASSLDNLTKEEAMQKQCEALQEVLQKLKKAFNTKQHPRKDYLVWGIVHDRDNITDPDDFFSPSAEKPHVHIYLVGLHDKSMQVSTLFNLLGIRQSEDDNELWKHGIRLIKYKDRAALYATHSTKDAENDGKSPYSISEVYTNNFDAYMELRGDGEDAMEKWTDADWAHAYKTVWELGYTLGDFDDWSANIPYSSKEKTTKMNLAQKEYFRGIEERIAEHEKITRCAIYIQGPPGVGKSYAIRHALKPYRTLDVSDGNTGQFDRLTPKYEAIYVDDSSIPASSLLKITDEYICNVYHRGNGNSYFCGSYCVITSNLTFQEYCESCGFQTTFNTGKKDEEGEPILRPTPQYEALRSRVFRCTISDLGYIKKLYYDERTDFNLRGTLDDIMPRMKLFQEFRNKFDKIISTYRPQTVEFDHDGNLISIGLKFKSFGRFVEELIDRAAWGFVNELANKYIQEKQHEEIVDMLRDSDDEKFEKEYEDFLKIPPEKTDEYFANLVAKCAEQEDYTEPKLTEEEQFKTELEEEMKLAFEDDKTFFSVADFITTTEEV